MNALVEMMGKKKKKKSRSLHTAKTNIDSNMYTPDERNVWNEEGLTEDTSTHTYMRQIK